MSILIVRLSWFRSLMFNSILDVPKFLGRYKYCMISTITNPLTSAILAFVPSVDKVTPMTSPVVSTEPKIEGDSLFDISTITNPLTSAI